MKDRIKKLRKCLGLNQRDFSSKIDIGSSTLAMFETGQRIPKDIHIKRICSEFSVNEEWLRNGIEPMFIQNNAFSLDELFRKQDATELEIEVIKAYMSLDKDVRMNLITAFKNTIADNSEQKNNIIRVPARGGFYEIEQTEERKAALKRDLKKEYKYNPDDF